MAQQKNVWGKMVSGTAGAAVGVKRAAHNAKQDGKVEDARKHIAALTYEIGRLTVRGMDRRHIHVDVKNIGGGILRHNVILYRKSWNVGVSGVCENIHSEIADGFRRLWDD